MIWRLFIGLLMVAIFVAAEFLAWRLIGIEMLSKIVVPLGIAGYLWLVFGVRWLRWRRRRRAGITNISFWSRKALP